MAREGAFCTSGPPHEVASGIVTQRASHSGIVVGLMPGVSLAVRASATAGNGVLQRLGVGGWRWRLRAPVRFGVHRTTPPPKRRRLRWCKLPAGRAAPRTRRSDGGDGRISSVAVEGLLQVARHHLFDGPPVGFASIDFSAARLSACKRCTFWAQVLYRARPRQITART